METELQVIHANLLPTASTVSDADMILVIQGGRPKRALPSAMKGAKGDDGRAVQLRLSTTALQWKYEGEDTWRELITVAKLQEPAIDAAVTANDAAQSANTAAKKANAATTNANAATANADKAVTDMNKEKDSVIDAIKAASEESTQKVNTAINKANDATESAKKATESATEATNAAQTATTNANAATEALLAKLDALVPSALTVKAPNRITLGNVEPIRIKAQLSPSTVMQNLIYISDNRAVDVGTDGVITPVAKGVSRVHVIPTNNTSLAKTILIEVDHPGLRLTAMSSMRFSESGGLRLT